MTSARRTLAAAVVATPWIAAAIVRGLGLDRRHPLVGLIALTPYVAVSAPVPVLVAVILRRRAVAVVAAVAALWLVAAVAPRAVGGPQAAPAGAPTLTVLSSNLYVGRADARAVVDLARREGADVVSLQEITPEALGRLDAAGLRRWPRRAADATDSLLVAREGRPVRPGVAELSVPLGGGRVAVQAVHPLPPITASSVRSWRATLRTLPPARRGPPRVIAGDFNATLDHRELRRLLDTGYADAADVTGGGLRTTWPVQRRRPPVTIDHVLADERLAVLRYEVHELPGTDHRAVLAELALR